MATRSGIRNSDTDTLAYVSERLAKVYGTAPANTTISTLRRRSPQLDQFDWLLLVMSLEIDLKVRIPQKLVDPKNLSVARFAKAVASLPRVASSDHTLETLQFLAQALLAAGEATPSPRTTRKGRR